MALSCCADLLSKPFGYTNSVEAKVPTKTGSTFTVNATVAPSASASVSVASAIGDFKVDKLAVGSDKTVSGEFSYADAFPGTKLTFKVGLCSASDTSSLLSYLLWCCCAGVRLVPRRQGRHCSRRRRRGQDEARLLHGRLQREDARGV